MKVPYCIQHTQLHNHLVHSCNCHILPVETYASKSKVHLKEECNCKNDDLWGRFCETPVQSV
ncbi:exostosin family, partial [Olea europaea subsp. europaea]